MGTLCLSGAVLAKAGVNVSSNTISGAFLAGGELYIDNYINQAECYINNISRKNWIDIYSTLNVDVKLILEEACSNLAAIYAIQYDMSGYTSRVEAEDMINVLYARFIQCVQVLQDQEEVTYIVGA